MNELTLDEFPSSKLGSNERYV